jgi:RimJ/RimL family protein N-acetyltransferase
MTQIEYPTRLETARLVLRPFDIGDAPRVFEIQSNWNVARMLRLLPWPATLESTAAWLATHESEWRSGTGCRFALRTGGRLIGCCDVDEIEANEGELGYWLDEAAWGRGYASEAAGAVVDFAFGPLGLSALKSGCAADNPASAHVLEKLGFQHVGDTEIWSNPRGEPIHQRAYRMSR